eukprot:CAMPEP_0180680514 /NCGR_PEP_ID=MMETSP1037_2-20121125/69521_1 /TAXON_ID=632150 /ORGANISM="Azadinium spinosum, Strain 3D9" /LENGTH=35 /DNA_ID= /DNA_START= /DNA_END= /DNA_ORIENTATION=
MKYGLHIAQQSMVLQVVPRRRGHILELLRRSAALA